MNTMCDAEYSEYEGQYPRDYDGSVIGCNCVYCRIIKENYGKTDKNRTKAGEANATRAMWGYYSILPK